MSFQFFADLIGDVADVADYASFTDSGSVTGPTAPAFNETFEGGVNGDSPTTTTIFTGANQNTYALSLSNTRSYNGALSFKFASNANENVFCSVNLTSSTSLYVRAYVYIQSPVANGTLGLMAVTNAYFTYVAVKQDGKLALINNRAESATTTSSYFSAWYRLEWDIVGTAQELRVYSTTTGLLLERIVGSCSGVPFSSFSLGSVDSANPSYSSHGTYYIDDVAADYSRNPSIATPISDGDTGVGVDYSAILLSPKADSDTGSFADAVLTKGISGIGDVFTGTDAEGPRSVVLSNGDTLTYVERGLYSDRQLTSNDQGRAIDKDGPDSLAVAYWRFTPPSYIDLFQMLSGTSFYVSQNEGYSILKVAGSYILKSTPLPEEMAAADIVYLGGRSYIVDQTEQDALTTAGYGPFIELSLQPSAVIDPNFTRSVSEAGSFTDTESVFQLAPSAKSDGDTGAFTEVPLVESPLVQKSASDTGSFADAISRMTRTANDTGAFTDAAVSPDRTLLVIGTDQPSKSNTGLKPYVTLTASPGNITMSTPGQVIQDLDIQGKVTVTAANCVIRNCRIRGLNSSPGSTDTFLITATAAGVSNLLIEDCELAPDFPHYNWDSAVTGHDFTIRRCNIYWTVDGINVFNTTAAQPYASNVTIEQNYIHDLGWWTAATTGVVHPSDTHTHNDVIQIQGGTGTIIRGNRLEGKYARQYGHWVVTNPNVEPYTQVGLNTLSDGGPYQSLPDRASGNEASGRYNLTNLSCVQMGQNVGDAYNFTFTDNWMYGGYISFNAASLARHTGQNLGSFLRNKFDRSQGAQGVGGNTTHTFDIDTSWAGNVTSGAGTANANVYMDDGTEVTFRTNV